MNRIWIIGCSGSGKSTLALQLANRLGLPSHELDGILHQAEWRQMPDAQFCGRLEEIVSKESWIIDGNYFMRCPGTIAARAEVVVWLDLPRLKTFLRVVRRSTRRLVFREQLLNGNRENWNAMFSWDPATNIVLRTWRQHPTYRQRYEQAIAEGLLGEAEIVRIRTPRALEAWLSRVG